MSTKYPVQIEGRVDYERELAERLGADVGPDEVYDLATGETIPIDEFKDQLDL